MMIPSSARSGASRAALHGARGSTPEWQLAGVDLDVGMQVVPRFVSTDADGGDEREFLSDVIADPNLLASLVFLKGYQWPFDIRKARDGSSIIDLLVYRETLRGRASSSTSVGASTRPARRAAASTWSAGVRPAGTT